MLASLFTFQALAGAGAAALISHRGTARWMGDGFPHGPGGKTKQRAKDKAARKARKANRRRQR